MHHVLLSIMITSDQPHVIMITNRATNKVLMLLACSLLAGFPVCVAAVVDSVGVAVGVS